MLDPDLMRRFIEHSHQLPPDVRAWAMGRVVDSLPPTERRNERNRLLRAAAALVPGRPWTRARRLHGIAKELLRAIPVAPDIDTARGCVAAALAIYPGHVPSVKQLYRIFSDIGA